MGEQWDEREPDQREPEQQRKLAAGYVELNEGDQCPLCRVGVLFKIAQDDVGYTLRCFNCNRQGSVHGERGHLAVTQSPRQTPTGLTLSRSQYEAQQDVLDSEEAAARNVETEAGSGVTSRNEVESG